MSDSPIDFFLKTSCSVLLGNTLELEEIRPALRSRLIAIEKDEN
jgi:hypothetical protein